MKNIKLILLLAVGIIIALGIGYYVKENNNLSYQQPEVQPKPPSETGVQVPEISFKFPEKPDTSYVKTMSWPPAAQLIDKNFTCQEEGTEISLAGKTQKITIANHAYCLTKKTEGAAGSSYTQYVYAFPVASKTAALSFTLRFYSCGVFTEAEIKKCEAEQQKFNIDSIIDQIAQTAIVK